MPFSRSATPENRAPRRRFAACAAAAAALALGACSSEEPEQDTPEEVLVTARTLVEKGEAERLPSLLYAENEEMRRLLNRAGRMLGNMEDLAATLQRKFPKEVEELRKNAEEAAKSGKPTSLVGQLAQQSMQRGRRRGPPSQQDRKSFDNAVTRLFADPYAFVRESEGRVTTTYLTDESVAVLWDGKPVLAPIGLTMRVEGGKWYVVLPTNLPGVANFMPKTKEQYQVMGSLITVLDRVVVDLNREVEEGRLQTLEAVSRRAGEMTFLPAVLTFYAYAKVVDEQKKQQPAAEKAPG